MTRFDAEVKDAILPKRFAMDGIPKVIAYDISRNIFSEVDKITFVIMRAMLGVVPYDY